MNKTAIAIIILLVLPLSYAQTEEEPQCGLTNLAGCIAEKFYEFTLGIINAPLQSFLELSKALLSEPINVDLFLPIWAIIIYIISLFYGIFILFAGFNFIISGYSYEKKNAKEWLKNVVLMVVF